MDLNQESDFYQCDLSILESEKSDLFSDSDDFIRPSGGRIWDKDSFILLGRPQQVLNQPFLEMKCELLSEFWAKWDLYQQNSD